MKRFEKNKLVDEGGERVMDRLARWEEYGIFAEALATPCRTSLRSVFSLFDERGDSCEGEWAFGTYSSSNGDSSSLSSSFPFALSYSFSFFLSFFFFRRLESSSSSRGVRRDDELSGFWSSAGETTSCWFYFVVESVNKRSRQYFSNFQKFSIFICEYFWWIINRLHVRLGRTHAYTSEFKLRFPQYQWKKVNILHSSIWILCYPTKQKKHKNKNHLW